MRFWLRTLTHVNFNQVNKIEVREKVLRLNEKLSKVQPLGLTSNLSCVVSVLFANVKFYAGKQVKLRNTRNQP